MPFTYISSFQMLECSGLDIWKSLHTSIFLLFNKHGSFSVSAYHTNGWQCWCKDLNCISIERWKRPPRCPPVTWMMMFIRFDRINECDRWMDRRTDTTQWHRPHLCIALHGNINVDVDDDVMMTYSAEATKVCDTKCSTYEQMTSFPKLNTKCIKPTWRESANGSWHQVSEGREEWCCDGNDWWPLILPQSSLDMSLPSAASAWTAHPQPVSTRQTVY